MEDRVSAPESTEARLPALLRFSADLILGLQDGSGAYPASPTFSAYRGYSWFRDGAFIAEAASRTGARWGQQELTDSATQFHQWCARVLTERADHIRAIVREGRAGREVPMSAMLPTRFTFAGEDGSDEWWDFQLDGYGTWLWALATHAQRSGIDPHPFAAAATLATEYLATFWDHPCFDWWEEHSEQRHLSTIGAIVAGLEAAARTTCADGSPLLADGVRAAATSAARAAREFVTAHGVGPDGALRKWVGSTEVDASLAACVAPFRLVPPGSPVARATLARIRSDLEVDGGVHRFRADVFFGGGQWPLLSCFLGWALAETDPAEARRYLEWAAAQATPSLDLPEQVPTHLLHPQHREEWIQRWGPVATPLLWSHAMVLTLADVLDLLEAAAPTGTPHAA